MAADEGARKRSPKAVRWWEHARAYPGSDAERQAAFPDPRDFDRRLRSGEDAQALGATLRAALARRQCDEVNTLLDAQFWDTEVWIADAQAASEELLCRARRKRKRRRSDAAALVQDTDASEDTLEAESLVNELNLLLAWDRKLMDVRYRGALSELKLRQLRESGNLLRCLHLAENAWTVPMGEVLIYHSAARTPAAHVTMFSKFGKEALRIPPEIVLARRHSGTPELFKQRKVKEMFILVPTDKRTDLDPERYNSFLKLSITPELAKNNFADLENGVLFHVVPLSAVQVDNVRHPALRGYVERRNVCFLGIALYGPKATARPMDDEPDPAGDEIWSLVGGPSVTPDRSVEREPDANLRSVPFQKKTTLPRSASSSNP